MLREIDERETYLVELFKDGDLLWTSEVIRGKLTELDFFRQIPQSLIASITVKEAQTLNEEDQADG